jgi:methionine sulfoxide reductase heme-binding subunit
VNRFLNSPWTKRVAFVLCLVPFAYLVMRGFQGRLTANPVEYITHFTGDWIIQFLLITLSITPLRTEFKIPALSRFRRMFGLFAFFYASLHFLVWFVLDRQLSFSTMWFDIMKRPYITMGMAGLALMIPLAFTSTAGWVRRMGFKRWQRLHRIVYFSLLAGIIHYFWLVKSDLRWPRYYAEIFGLLMLYRVMMWVKKRKPVPKRVAQPVSAR